MKDKPVIYYTDELNDELSGSSVKARVIDSKYKYIHTNIFYKFFTFIVYRIIATPIGFIYKWIKGIKVENKKVLKKISNNRYFIYANHTNQFSDVFMPHIITFPKKVYTIVRSENTNIPILKNATNMLGALPIPTGMDGTRNFMQAVEKRSVQGNPILIYPEAHLWKYYTGIRPFKSTSFKYPIKFQDPTFCFTTTYQKPKHGKKPKIVIYVDGPFYPKKDLDIKQQQEDLRNQVYECMCKRSKLSNYEMIKYVKRGETND